MHHYFRDLISYRETVEAFDSQFGAFLDALEERQLLDDAWIVFTSDHGESLNEKTPLGRVSSHKGNPSFQTELEIPLITVPAIFPERSSYLRTPDIPRRLLEALGLEPLVASPELEEDELFVSEVRYRTYRRGRYKSMHARATDRTLLFDLETDPHEQLDVAKRHPEIVGQHRARVAELSDELRSELVVPRELTVEDLARLKALGYAN